MHFFYTSFVSFNLNIYFYNGVKFRLLEDFEINIFRNGESRNRILLRKYSLWKPEAERRKFSWVCNSLKNHKLTKHK